MMIINVSSSRFAAALPSGEGDESMGKTSRLPGIQRKSLSPGGARNQTCASVDADGGTGQMTHGAGRRHAFPAQSCAQPPPAKSCASLSGPNQGTGGVFSPTHQHHHLPLARTRQIQRILAGLQNPQKQTPVTSATRAWGGGRVFVTLKVGPAGSPEGAPLLFTEPTLGGGASFCRTYPRL